MKDILQKNLSLQEVILVSHGSRSMSLENYAGKAVVKLYHYQQKKRLEIPAFIFSNVNPQEHTHISQGDLWKKTWNILPTSDSQPAAAWDRKLQGERGYFVIQYPEI